MSTTGGGGRRGDRTHARGGACCEVVGRIDGNVGRCDGAVQIVAHVVIPGLDRQERAARLRRFHQDPFGDIGGCAKRSLRRSRRPGIPGREGRRRGRRSESSA